MFLKCDQKNLDEKSLDNFLWDKKLICLESPETHFGLNILEIYWGKIRQKFLGKTGL